MIKIKNYRQLKDLNIDFGDANKHDLHIVVGKNGSGKTNLLNAINWCLYEEEPHLNKQSEPLPIVNLNAIEASNNANHIDVIVELTIVDDNNHQIVYERKNRYKFMDSNLPSLVRGCLQVRFTDIDGNIHIHEGDKAKIIIERFVPYGIREFFFFDGERLDMYFKEATAEKISQATFKISQIDLLENIEDKMVKISKEMYKEASRVNPELEDINLEIENLEKNIQEHRDTLGEIEAQISKSEIIIKDCEEYLSGTPNIDELEDRRKKIVTQLEAKKDMRISKIKKKQDLLFQSGIVINLRTAIDETLKVIEVKRKNNELPPNPNTDTTYLRDILSKDFCNACNRALDESSRESIESFLNKIKVSTESSRQLWGIENTLKNFKRLQSNFSSEVSSVTSDIIQLENDLQQIDEEKNKIDAKLSSYSNKDKIKDNHEQRKNHEQLKDNNLKKYGAINSNLNNLKNMLESTNKKREKALEADRKQEKLNRQIDFCRDVIASLDKSKNLIMAEVREDIEKETKKIFFELLWKKETYSDIKIDHKYNISLIHSMGYNCLGSASAAERALLALSFTLALHKVSNFNSPIIIDTPVSRISDENRKNFAITLANMSANKQFFMLFTPDEYSQDVKDAFAEIDSKKYRYQLSADERETTVEVY